MWLCLNISNRQVEDGRPLPPKSFFFYNIFYISMAYILLEHPTMGAAGTAKLTGSDGLELHGVHHSVELLALGLQLGPRYGKK